MGFSRFRKARTKEKKHALNIKAAREREFFFFLLLSSLDWKRAAPATSSIMETIIVVFIRSGARCRSSNFRFALEITFIDRFLSDLFNYVTGFERFFSSGSVDTPERKFGIAGNSATMFLFCWSIRHPVFTNQSLS